MAHKQVSRFYVCSPERTPRHDYAKRISLLLYYRSLLCSADMDTCADANGTDNRVTPSEEAAQRSKYDTDSQENPAGVVLLRWFARIGSGRSAIVSANQRVTPYSPFKFELHAGELLTAPMAPLITCRKKTRL